VRHRLETILRVAVCAVSAGARSYVAIAEWAADTDEVTRVELGIAGAVPSESTIRRVLQRLDAEAFDAQVGAWAQARSTPPAGVAPCAPVWSQVTNPPSNRGKLTARRGGPPGRAEDRLGSPGPG
jgi:hypothetical protein